jgi:tetratricopeptide (TPR) repeat protein
VKREIGDLAEARKGYEESLAIRQEIGDKRGGAMGRVELAMTLLEQGELAASRQTIEEALSLARDTKLRPGEAQALYVLGEISLAEDDLAAARKNQEAALAIRNEMREDRTIVESQMALAEIDLAEGRPAEAETKLNEIKKNLAGGNATAAQATTEILLGSALLAQHKVDAAGQTIARAQNLSATTQRQEVRAMNTIALARLDSARKRPEAAIQRLTNLADTLKRNGGIKLQFEARLAQCEAQLQADKTTAARDCSSSLEKDAQALGFKRVVVQATALVHQ